MSITDELRGFANSGMSAMECVVYSDKLIAIADRIDAVVKGMVELPKDADGEHIHMGDKMECFTSQHRDVPKVFEVQRIIMDNITGWRLVAYPATYVPEECRHYHAPTVEDVLLEFGEWYAHTKGGCDEDGIIAEYAAKLRLIKEDS